MGKRKYDNDFFLSNEAKKRGMREDFGLSSSKIVFFLVFFKTNIGKSHSMPYFSPQMTSMYNLFPPLFTCGFHVSE